MSTAKAHVEQKCHGMAERKILDKGRVIVSTAKAHVEQKCHGMAERKILDKGRVIKSVNGKGAR